MKHLCELMTTLHFTYNNFNVRLLCPLSATVQNTYAKQLATGEKTDFPFWSKVWASATAVSRFLTDHPQLIRDKQVLELAGGLGLPSLVAAHFAARVCYSDYLPEPVEIVKQSAELNQLTNLTCRQLDWNHLPEDLAPDVLILSDINYNPDDFESLLLVLTSFINLGTVVILSTPQRLMGKPFIERLMPWRQMTEVLEERDGQVVTLITILVLAKQDLNIVPTDKDQIDLC